MELFKKLPTNFFEKSRPNTPKKSLEQVTPFKWSNEQDILKGKYKDKEIVSLSKKK